MNHVTVVDGFAKKCAGLSGGNTWNDIMGYGYLTSAEVGPIAATITDGTPGVGLSQKLLSADMGTQIAPYRLTDDSTVGMSVPGMMYDGTNYTNLVCFKITVQRL
jgi:hypothetical protein